MEMIFDSTNKVYISEKKLETPHVYAETDWSTEEIVISPKKNTLAESVHSFIHEHLHLLMGPDEKEAVIYRMARAVYEDMSVKEKQRIFRLMARRAVWED